MLCSTQTVRCVWVATILDHPKAALVAAASSLAAAQSVLNSNITFFILVSHKTNLQLQYLQSISSSIYLFEKKTKHCNV